VLLVTKAVGDLLGVRGIADEMIRFNGYPFLEHDDHALDVPGTLTPAFMRGRKLMHVGSGRGDAKGLNRAPRDGNDRR
jgi:hypothetical protein